MPRTRWPKNLLNRTMESVIQSAGGVNFVYAGLVYSQRF